MNTLLVRQERALHCIDRDPLKVVQREPKCFCGCLKLLAHGGAAHQAVVRVQRDAELLLIENFERMLRQTGRGAGVNVAQQANLEGDALVEDVLSQVAQLHCFAVHDGNIIDQPRAVPDAVRPAILNRLPDRFFSVPFAGVNRDVEVLALDVMKSIHVLLCGIPAFFSRKIKAHHAACAEIDSQFRHLQRGIHVAHRAND